jgi:hypothetical protein
MKEFQVPFKEGFAKGLKQWKRTPRGQEGLSSCYNLKPKEEGLRSYEYVSNPTAATIDWPFPQLFLGQDVRIVATATAIYELTAWALGAAKCTVTENERWDFIDFGSYLILTNGTKLCIRDYAGAWTTNDYTTYIPRFSTGCNFNGQVVAGNIKTTWHGCGTGSIIWSKIGSIDFTPDGTNEAGFRNIPWEGSVLRVKKLGKGVVVYCENGIGLLSPFQQTFGWDVLTDIGLDCKGAVGGNENIHVFVGKDRLVYRINSQYQIEKLGYNDQFQLMASNDIVVEHNPLRHEFYLSDRDEGFVLTEQGLAQCFQQVTSCAPLNEASYGIADDNEDLTAYIITEPLDFGLRGMKTIQSIEISGQWTTEDTEVYVQVYYRNDANGSWTAGGYGIVNPNGVAHVATSGVEFLLWIYFADYTNIELDSMNIHVKLTDKRYVRGAYNVA